MISWLDDYTRLRFIQSQTEAVTQRDGFLKRMCVSCLCEMSVSVGT